MEVKDDYLNRLPQIDPMKTQLSCVFMSSVTGEPVETSAELGSEYWCRNLTSPVLFQSAIQNIVNTLRNPLFLEVGAHSVLLGPLRDNAPSISYIPTLIRGENAYTSILRTAGRLFQHLDIDLSILCVGKTLGDLPPYQWNRDRRFWSETRVSRNWRFRQHPHHELLGSQMPDGNDMEPLWRSVIHLENVPWLRDHVIDDKIILPRACYFAMGGEAIRQITGQAEFSLRRVSLLAEATLHEDHSVEILTQLRPSEESHWYDLTMDSYSEGTWTKLCIGQVRDGRHLLADIARLNPMPRKIRDDVFYRTMRRIRVRGGPRFCALQNISTNFSSTEAAAEVKETQDGHESHYAIDPSTFSNILQLLSVANGEGRNLNCLAVPTYVEEVYVCPSSGPISAQCTVTSAKGSPPSANLAGFSGDGLVLAMNNAKLSVSNQLKRGPDPHAGARLVWQPDIEDINVDHIIRPSTDGSKALQLVEEMALACIVETAQQTLNAASPPHLAKYHQWLSFHRRLAEQSNYENVPCCQYIALMPSIYRKRHIEDLYRRALATPAGPIATAVCRIYQESSNLFNQKTEPLDLLMQDDLLSVIYGTSVCDFSDYFRVFAHNRPCMRVLETGAGTGGATASILPALHGPNGELLYESYTYTDISAGFFDRARERFRNYEGVIWRRLDITADIAAQGFDASYDLVVATNVLHATPNLQETLRNVKALLKPDGKLFLQELAPATKWINYIMGTLPGWWLSTDNRPWEPYMSPERWDAELRAAGLSGADAVVHDGQMNAHIISSVQKPCLNRSRDITILCEKNSQHLDKFVSCFHQQGFTIDIRHLRDKLPADRMVISILELDAPLLDFPNSQKYLDLRNMITNLEKPPMLWVTRPSQVGCSDPHFAATLGLLRTARRELGLTIATLELDTVDDNAVQAAFAVAERIQCLNTESNFDPVLEYAYSRGTLMIGRFYPAVVSEELLETRDSADEHSGAVLQIDDSGDLGTIRWERQVLALPQSGDNWVEVQPRAIGIEANDVPTTDSAFDIASGTECAGTIKSVGPDVKNLHPGDRVIVLSPGCALFASRFVTNEKLCVRMARDLSWAEGATIPYAFATALYSLIDVARIKHGDVCSSVEGWTWLIS